MPNVVNEILLQDLEKEFKDAGSCLVVSFDALTVETDQAVRRKFDEMGLRYQVVKNRLAQKALANMDVDLSDAFKGKCGVVFAEEEQAISAAKALQEMMQKAKKSPIKVTGGLIEGEAITGAAAAMIAHMPDKNTVRAMLATAISGPARSLATCVSGLPSGLARVMQANIDKNEGGGEG